MKRVGGGFDLRTIGVAERPETDDAGMPTVPAGYRRAAVRMVASRSESAGECAEFLQMLGLSAEMGVIRAEAA